MVLFHDVRFPLHVSLGARGGPARRTDVLALASGAEHRNAPHRHSRRRYQAGVGVKSRADIARLLDFFEARAGRLHSFRFRDPLDHTGELLVHGDGRTTRFAVHKTYGDTAAAYRRPIAHLFDVTTTPDLPRTVERGAVVFDTAPTGPVTIRYTFDTTVRFDTDQLEIGLEDALAGEVLDLPLVEVLPHEVAP